MKPSSTSRLLALSIVTAGILTFFYPVTVDPPVASVTRWSPFAIVLQMYNGVLPAPTCERCGEPVVRALLALPFLVIVEYVFMMAAGVALCSLRSVRAIIWIAVFGIYNCVSGEYGIGTRLEFERTFFGPSRSGHVHYGGLMTAHLVVMAALVLASLDLRDEKSEEVKMKSKVPVETREPCAIDGEIVQENGIDETPPSPPRLHN